ncbi:hypothetical protein [Marinobacterium mangrovicola]|uniref:Uncharacterized protein n=1 Tax=Marinobacterium mangrovicola TaxID=1476959 RepID=A0A4R1GDE8_9GAMM|nr:hypothetical protein [Marinobacterium mangrovicola]TCK05868.1 hypothetical protein CLV83_2808 [Marinobacterium mangrovicola]
MKAESNAGDLTPNPRIMRYLEKSALLRNDLLPVDTMNSALIPTEELPYLPHPKKRKLIDYRGKRRVSYQLRFLYDALVTWTVEREGYCTSFVTLHFSREYERRLKQRKKGPAGAFSDSLQKSLKALVHDASFFLVVEQGFSENKRLHAHVVISYHPEDREALMVVMRHYSDNTKIQDDFELMLKPKSGSFVASAIELDDEHGLNAYEKKKGGRGGYSMKLPVNIGAADYISKQVLSNRVRFKGSPIYAPQDLRRRAADLYADAYEQQQLLKAQGRI